MAGINKVIIVGNLGRDPEVSYTASGAAVAKFSVATSETWKDKTTGEKKERTEWHRIVAWDKLGEICGKYLAKGRQVYVEGKLQTRSYDDKEGIKRYSTEIVAQDVQFLGGNREAADGARAGGGPSMREPSGPPGGAPGGPADDDDIPF
jgi:single-strand DNA-binding protein